MKKIETFSFNEFNIIILPGNIPLIKRNLFITAHAFWENFFICSLRKQSGQKSFCIDYWWISYFLCFLFWHYKFLISPSVHIRSYSCCFVFWSIETSKNEQIYGRINVNHIAGAIPSRHFVSYSGTGKKSKLEFVSLLSLPPYCSKTNQNQIVLSHSHNNSQPILTRIAEFQIELGRNLVNLGQNKINEQTKIDYQTLIILLYFIFSSLSFSCIIFWFVFWCRMSKVRNFGQGYG